MIMSTLPPELDEMGPIDYLVIEFPKFRVTGEGMKALLDLVDRRIIRILDLVFVHKKEDGAVSVTAITDMDGDGIADLAVFEGACSSLLDDGDIKEAAEALEPGSAGGILVYENMWAAPLARTLRHSGAQLVGGGRIPVQAILAATAALESTEA
jgi:hypothetical protein